MDIISYPLSSAKNGYYIISISQKIWWYISYPISYPFLAGKFEWSKISYTTHKLYSHDNPLTWHRATPKGKLGSQGRSAKQLCAQTAISSGVMDFLHKTLLYQTVWCSKKSACIQPFSQNFSIPNWMVSSTHCRLAIAQKFQMATEYRDISSLCHEKMDIYHDIISTIEKRIRIWYISTNPFSDIISYHISHFYLGYKYPQYILK